MNYTCFDLTEWKCLASHETNFIISMGSFLLNLTIFVLNFTQQNKACSSAAVIDCQLVLEV